ncbi:hypothetical protein EMIHUDRAFT_119655 [Emiliania huxleyi CCMP1516]|uniref:Glycosyltransferase family 92 protein n=2 Tax=Emiliania huxleyi TaxID=2903 RepID=A0A0D3IRY6_EMIH1|nr:hypothetical protein EMIHUDRAFT_119655 [Emiliania huxleyi CCMP1516]EOD14021.1 hypothetical protein EMIHUDRAFT_119655 [Emiliania huxleyi CCMP1516]|eukprot:XP_005766450.1 hypothetical protein EMIHUDRAFT_119655 [Emiliania huxleyi CCMP1516]
MISVGWQEPTAHLSYSNPKQPDVAAANIGKGHRRLGADLKLTSSLSSKGKDGALGWKGAYVRFGNTEPGLLNLVKGRGKYSPSGATAAVVAEEEEEEEAAEAEEAGAEEGTSAGSARLPPSVASRTYLYAFVVASAPELLAHFIHHYRELGIDFAARSRLIVDPARGDEATAALARREAASFALLREAGVPYSNNTQGTWSSKLKSVLVNEYLRALPADALLMYPDLDEFFSLPCGLEAMLPPDARVNLQAKFVDRLAPHWACAPQPRLVGPSGRRPIATSIHAQFPVQCDVAAFLSSSQSSSVSLLDAKRVLVSARDAHGRLVQYRTAHSVTCVTAAGEPDAARAAASKGGRPSACKLSQPLKTAEMPRIAHFRFSHEGVALLWRKLDRYQRNKRAAAEEPRDGGRRKDDGTALKLSGRFATHVKGYAEQCKLFSASGEGDVRPSPASDGFWFSNSSIAGIRATCRRETAGLAQC